LTDNQAAITALSSTIISSKMVWEYLDKLNELGRNNKATGFTEELREMRNLIFWLKKGQNYFYRTRTLLWLGGRERVFTYCKHELKLQEEHEIAKLWEQLTALVHSKKLLGGYNRERSKEFVKLSKSYLRLTHRFPLRTLSLKWLA